MQLHSNAADHEPDVAAVRAHVPAHCVSQQVHVLTLNDMQATLHGTEVNHGTAQHCWLAHHASCGLLCYAVGCRSSELTTLEIDQQHNCALTTQPPKLTGTVGPSSFSKL
eukprot:GHRQ01024837.1.p1 GENE.GHRQ01024837.1~~GHRQ01024837.1.p1  ORF type:complete len:110 (-),score=1.98 GHRQ01024837.1:96-425(-)